MFDKKQFDAALTCLGDLTDEQKAVLEDARENGYPEQVLFEKLGVKPDAFEAFMKAIAKREQLFRQTVSEEELTAAAGGIDALHLCDRTVHILCDGMHYRRIYDNRFPNCASAVKEDSWCSENDACYADVIEYVDLKTCGRAWR